MVGKLIAIFVMGVAIWVAGNHLTGDGESVFSGLFSDESKEAQAAGAGSADDLMAQPSSPARLMGKMVDRAHNAQEQNYQRILDQEQALFGE